MLNNNLKKDASPGTLISFLFSKNGLALGLAVTFGIVQIAGIAWLGSIKLRSPAVFASPSSLSRVDIGNDWTRFEINDTPQFAISLPSDWIVTEFRFDDIERFADDIASNSPELAALLQSEDGKKKLECCMKMYAYHPDEDGSAETLVMVTVPVKPGTELEGFVNAQFVEMEKNFIQPGSGKIERVPTRAGEAELIKGNVLISLPDRRQQSNSINQFYFINGQSIMILTLTEQGFTGESTGKNLQIFSKIVMSFEWQ